MTLLPFRHAIILSLMLGAWSGGAMDASAQIDVLNKRILNAPPLPPPPADIPSASAGGSMTPEQTRRSVQWLADQLMLHVPRTIEGDDDWGKTKKVWAGIKIHRDGWELKTKRRWRHLRHGRWVRYEILLPPPTVALRPSRSLFDEFESDEPDGTGNSIADAIEIHQVTAVMTPAGARRWQVEVSVSTPAEFAVRVERWNLGGQWYSIEISGKMTLHLRTTLTMALQADFAEVPPAMQLDVEIENASLAVSRFEVERISKLGGDVAEEIGDLAEKTIGKIWLRKENARLTARLNKAIARNHDSLRWSMADWIAQLAP